MDMATLIREQARLIILRSLAAQVDDRLNSDILVESLRQFGITRERAWVHDELRWLAEMGAVTLMQAGSVLVATLTAKGGRHVARETVIEGVQRPSRTEV